MSFSRRGFLSGRFRPGSQELRPPWAIVSGAFEERCNRCGGCIKTCALLVAGDGGFPSVDFSRGECTFCGECVQLCKRDALSRSDGIPPWTITASIGDSCLAAQGVECRICGEACPTAAIRFRPQLGGVARPQLDSDRCTGCGACYAPCPVRAIEMNHALEKSR